MSPQGQGQGHDVPCVLTVLSTWMSGSYGG